MAEATCVFRIVDAQDFCIAVLGTYISQFKDSSKLFHVTEIHMNKLMGSQKLTNSSKNRTYAFESK